MCPWKHGTNYTNLSQIYRKLLLQGKQNNLESIAYKQNFCKEAMIVRAVIFVKNDHKYVLLPVLSLYFYCVFPNVHSNF